MSWSSSSRSLKSLRATIALSLGLVFFPRASDHERLRAAFEMEVEGARLAWQLGSAVLKSPMAGPGSQTMRPAPAPRSNALSDVLCRDPPAMADRRPRVPGLDDPPPLRSDPDVRQGADQRSPDQATVRLDHPRSATGDRSDERHVARIALTLRGRTPQRASRPRRGPNKAASI
jgi:hypothetical protein